MLRVSVVFLACLLTCASAGAVEVCVSCEKPVVVYRCSVEKSDVLEKYGVDAQAVPAVCLKILTRTGGHEKCQVVETKDAPCNGTVKVLGLADLQQAASGDPAKKKVVPSLMDRTKDSLKESWTCVTSLFQTC